MIGKALGVFLLMSAIVVIAVLEIIFSFSEYSINGIYYITKKRDK